jgi:hypothetical protein
MATTSQIAAFIPIKIPSISFMFLSFLFDVFKILREREFGGFREDGITLLDGNFTGKVGGGGGSEVVGHARKLAWDSDNATKKMFFFDVFFLDFSQLIEREELTPIGPRRGRGDVSF